MKWQNYKYTKACTIPYDNFQDKIWQHKMKVTGRYLWNENWKENWPILLLNMMPYGKQVVSAIRHKNETPSQQNQWMVAKLLEICGPCPFDDYPKFDLWTHCALLAGGDIKSWVFPALSWWNILLKLFWNPLSESDICRLDKLNYALDWTDRGTYNINQTGITMKTTDNHFWLNKNLQC